VRVLELGQLIAGPYCGQLLGDFGADAVKLEAPGAGDPMRRWGIMHEGKSLSWPVFGRNKRCIAADLHSDEGRELGQRLIDVADIVVENFRPGTLERLGLGYEEMSARNPGIVYVRLTGYGQDGPYSSRAGYGSIGEAMGGLRYISGEPDRAPSRIGISIGDELAGLHGALGALMALRNREQTGRGQVVDVSIYESVLALSEALIPEYALAGVIRQRTGTVLPHVAPSNLYLSSDGEHILVASPAGGMGRPARPGTRGRAGLADHRVRPLALAGDIAGEGLYPGRRGADAGNDDDLAAHQHLDDRGAIFCGEPVGGRPEAGYRVVGHALPLGLGVHCEFHVAAASGGVRRESDHQDVVRVVIGAGELAAAIGLLGGGIALPGSCGHRGRRGADGLEAPRSASGCGRRARGRRGRGRRGRSRGGRGRGGRARAVGSRAVRGGRGRAAASQRDDGRYYQNALCVPVPHVFRFLRA
jgi:CoA-transferase family III